MTILMIVAVFVVLVAFVFIRLIYDPFKYITKVWGSVCCRETKLTVEKNVFFNGSQQASLVNDYTEITVLRSTDKQLTMEWFEISVWPLMSFQPIKFHFLFSNETIQDLTLNGTPLKARTLFLARLRNIIGAVHNELIEIGDKRVDAYKNLVS